MSRKSIGVGLMGLGVVAGQVARVLTEKAADLEEKIGCPLVLRKIKVLPEDLSRPQAREMSSGLFTTSDDDFFQESDIDIIVEAIGGENPALGYHRRALKSGRHVVTSNKELIAKHGVELLELAHQHNVSLQYEASVGAGFPLIAPFKHDLVANRITGIFAIINGTTNYILTMMDRKGSDFAATLAQAQKLGYAEANPENDIEGFDSNYKLAILASLAFNMRVRPQDVYREGITRLAPRDFRYARELGFTIKLLAIAKQNEDTVEARVHPVFIPQETLLAKVDGVYNAVQVMGDLAGRVLFMGEGAGPLATSSSVVADVVGVARKIVLGIGSLSTWKAASGKRIKPIDDIETQYYIRLNAADQPGVLAKIATVFGDNEISIASAIQPESDEATGTAEIVIMTHPAMEKAMQKALRELGKLEVVNEINNCIRVEEIEGG
ncbi:MAG TPA: homoserine dehydrogenase [Dehalococcoidia bacterium]|nr:homoserine dehydrogenase [Dehalococcoidia bacterium]